MAWLAYAKDQLTYAAHTSMPFSTLFHVNRTTSLCYTERLASYAQHFQSYAAQFSRYIINLTSYAINH